MTATAATAFTALIRAGVVIAARGVSNSRWRLLGLCYLLNWTAMVVILFLFFATTANMILDKEHFLVRS